MITNKSDRVSKMSDEVMRTRGCEGSTRRAIKAHAVCRPGRLEACQPLVSVRGRDR